MHPFQDASRSPARRAEDLLGRLTLREKVGQLNQRLYGFSCYTRTGDDFALTEECLAEMERWGGLGVLYGLYRADPWSAKDERTGIPPRLAARVYNLVQRQAMAHSRFGIPVLMSSECPHGHQALGGYLLPPALAMAASFAPALVQRAFAVCGGQMKAQGVDLALVSVLDVLRDPRWGRSEECFGEDPHLCAAMAGAAVAGLGQGGVAAVAKHLCAQGQTTGGVNGSPAAIGRRELEDIHLPPVAAACAAGATGFMAAYNDIDGVPCHANPQLLRDYLRSTLGFSGIVMADGTALDRLDAMTGSNVASAAAALQSGVDVSLWDTAFTHLEQVVEKGLVAEAQVDEAVRRVLELKFARGLFERPLLPEDAPPPVFTVESHPENLELARHSVVLLKNQGDLLPIQPAQGATYALIGPHGEDVMSQLGDYSPPLEPEQGATLRQGMEAIAHPAGATLLCAQGSGVLRGSRQQREQALAAAQRADVVVLALGGSSSRFAGARFDINGAAIPGGDIEMDCGEGVDVADLRLPLCQRQLAQEVFSLGKPVVAVVNAGRPYAIGDIAQKADALLYAFYPGPWGGRALAEILFGRTPPAGRLPAGLPHSAGQLPCYHDPMGGYTPAYADGKAGPLFAFGAGLATTTFSYGNFALTDDVQGGLGLACTVANTGLRAGWAAPMVYLREAGKHRLARSRQLCGFAKCLLQPGQSQRLHLPLALHTHQGKQPVLPRQVVKLWVEENANRLWDANLGDLDK